MNANALRQGMTLTCPNDGAEEKVVTARRTPRLRSTWVRTSRHDHYFTDGQAVTAKKGKA